MTVRTRLTLGLCALALAAAAAMPAAAQGGRPQTREGYWISFGLGAGSAGIDCSVCPDDRENGATLYLRMGGTPSPRLLIGGELNGWGKEENDVEMSVGSLMGVVQFYPAATGGFFLTGGLGFLGMVLEDPTDEVESNGFGVQVGAGYDIRLGRRFSLSPFATYVHGFSGEPEVNGVTVKGMDVNPNFFHFGLGFTWH
jgi:hypothetical protein